MSAAALMAVVVRMTSDPAFAAAVARDPGTVLAEFDLTDEERAALGAPQEAPPDHPAALEPRMSRSSLFFGGEHALAHPGLDVSPHAVDIYAGSVHADSAALAIGHESLSVGGDVAATAGSFGQLLGENMISGAETVAGTGEAAIGGAEDLASRV